MYVQMCARLNASRLSTVQREKENLAKFANDPFDGWFPVFFWIILFGLSKTKQKPTK